MSESSLFIALSSQHIAALILQATRHVCYAAPGIQAEVADAILRLKTKSPGVSVVVNLDFSEKTLRLGYGSLAAVEKLRKHGVQPVHYAGFRSSVLLIDDRGWVYTPTALYLESEPHSNETPNALGLSTGQVQDLRIRLSPAARQEAIQMAPTPEAAKQIADTPLDVSTHPVEESHFVNVQKAIELAPPVKFDVARQVRVFEPYLQYVELSLTGAAVERHRVRIPKSIQGLDSAKELEGRLQTTFDLIESRGDLSSKKLEAELNEIRKNFTPSLGKDHGRVVLKNAKPKLIERIEELRKKLEAHQAKVENELQISIDESKKQVVEYYLPIVRNKVPDALLGQSLHGVPDDDAIRRWLHKELAREFPHASKLVKKMRLDERYKDVTYETLNQPDFLEAVSEAFPYVDWKKAYSEFKAAGEAGDQRSD